MRIQKKIWQPLVRRVFGLLIGRQMPKPVVRALGALAYAVSGRYRRVADKNLLIAYGDSMTEVERDVLIRRVFQSFATSTAEFLEAPRWTPDQVKALAVADSYEVVDKVLARGKGMILLAAHFGNWELLARRAAVAGYSFAVIARQSEDAAFNEITDSLRANGGYTVLPRGGSPKPILSRLRANGIIAILPDQKSEDVFVPFFGKLAGTVAGPAVLALKTGAGIVPMFCPRQPDGTYKVIISPEIDTTSTGNTEADIKRIMTDATAVIEEMIRKYPDQWLWLHDRWRVPAPSEAILAEKSADAPSAAATV